MARGTGSKKGKDKPDAAATRYCDVCQEDINVQTGGDRNFEMHTTSKKHKSLVTQNESKAVSGVSKLKKTLVTAFFAKTPKPSPGSNNIGHSSTDIASLDSTPAPRSSPVSTVIDVDLEDEHLIAEEAPDDVTAILLRLRTLTSTLPLAVSIAEPDDTLARFSTDPRASSAESDSADDIYEKVINRVMDNTIGNEKDVGAVSRLIRRGPLGMEGFCRWVEICLVEIGISLELLGPRVGRVCDAMKLCGANEYLSVPPPIPVAAESLHVPLPVRKSKSPCHGFKLDIEGSPWTSYPFGLHPHLDLPWSVFVDDEALVLRSVGCTAVRAHKARACHKCMSLGTLDLLVNIMDRIIQGPHRNASWRYYTVENLIDLLHSKNAQINRLKLNQLNLEQSLLVRARHLDAFKRFLFAVAKGDIPRLHALVATMLKDGAAIFAILDKISMASNQLYHPKSYADSDYKQLFLFHKLGGRAVAELAHRTRGLPSIDSTRRYIRTQPLFPSAKMPTIDEMSMNLDVSYPPKDLVDTEAPARPVIGFQLMTDEIKIESRLRWDARTNKILGVCREHSKNVSMDFESIAEPDAIIEGINKKELHFASEATVMAVSHFSDAPNAYSAHPFVISGSCKQEDVPSQRTLLETAVTILQNDKKDDIGGRLYCITSDGDARRRRATAAITLIADLDLNDPIRKKLGELRLFNYKCGHDAVTSDIEYKHLFKRFRSALIRSAGCQINGSLINQEILRQHLQSTGLDKSRIDIIISPSDKQDVKLMYDLLSAIAVLPDANPAEKPSVHNTRSALQLLGKFYAHLLEAYTDINMSLREQLQHLSAAAHLVMAIYSSDKGNSMPSQTYFDMMTTIKNVFFCVAKTQVDDPNGSFWIILIGTDTLERLFGKIRTMIGSDSNCDHLQLGNRCESAAICTQILGENPTWEAAPRRLTLKTWRDEAGDLSAQVDHISPKTWKGDVKVKGVVILTCWEEGRRTATAELKKLGYATPFEAMDSGDGFDIFCPFGQNNMVLLGRPTEGEREEDAEEIAMSIEARTTYAQQDTAEDEPAPIRASEPDAEAPSTSAVLEDLATEELSRISASVNPTANKPKHDAYVLVHSSSGNDVQQHKSSVCRVYSEPLTVRDSHARLERVRGYPRNITTSAPTPAFGVETGSPSEPCIAIQDPAALLVRSSERVWLSVVEIYGIKQGSTILNRIPVRLLREPNVRIIVRIICLSSRDDADDMGDWGWSAKFEKSTFETEGRWIQPLDPSIINSSSRGTVVPGYAFKTSELLEIAKQLYGNSRHELDRFHSVSRSDSFPYRLPNGASCFICEDDVSSRGTIQTQHRCPLCPTLPLTMNPPGKLVEHLAQHILNDPTVQARTSPCGFCGGSGNQCAVFTGKAKGSKGAVYVDTAKSRCKNGNVAKLSIASGAKSTPSSPSTNRPIACPICASSNPSAPAIWKYNLRAHIQDVHPQANVDDAMYTDLYRIDRFEVTALRGLWERKKRTNASMIQKFGTINISDAHSAHLNSNNSHSKPPQANDSDSEPDDPPAVREASYSQGMRPGSEMALGSSSDNSEPEFQAVCDGNAPPNTLEVGPEEADAVELSAAQVVCDADEPLAMRRTKRARAVSEELAEKMCAEDDCEDTADVRPMVACAGPGCGLVFHLTCRGLTELPGGGWYCGTDCRYTAASGVKSRGRKRARK